MTIQEKQLEHLNTFLTEHHLGDEEEQKKKETTGEKIIQYRKSVCVIKA